MGLFFVFQEVVEGEVNNSPLLFIGADRDREHLKIILFSLKDRKDAA